MADEVAAALAPAIDAHPGAAVVDATCGAGGHTAAILGRSRPARVILLDRDVDALAHARARLAGAACPLMFHHAAFSQLAALLDELGVERIAALIADLGVSSHQLDEGPRGFSFRYDAPLDMRMDPSRGPTAAELLASLEADALADALARFGEEPEARRIARAIVAARPRTTGELADVVEQAMSARARRALGRRIHPATRTFQALRILVNGELDELDALLRAAPERLLVAGRMAVISFHSLEDRRVKRRFAELSRAAEVPAHLPLRADELPRPRFELARELPRRGHSPAAAELEANPRSRSARLRVLQRVSE